ncbi:MAG TPA: aldo/keto reductase [Azospirillaceae bacterium]|nr:aldo/keto reductase [Azospirillaceae bacterium]
MQYRPFGRTGLTVSVLGFGAGQVGDARMPEEEAGRLLNLAADLGITLFDTARGYGLSEERIGRHLAHRRGGLVLSTKVGYGIEGHEDWTYSCVAAGVDAALRRLNTDVIDVVHLHSCPRETLERGDVVRALEEAVAAGKVRVAGYSGENEALDWAVGSGRFGAVEHSLSICDQRVIDGALVRSRAEGLGVIAKRPVANAPWRFQDCPKGDYAEEYWWRWRTMGIDPRGLDWQELALRFAAFTPGVHSCIVGTGNPEHLRRNVALLEEGPLEQDHVAAIRHAFSASDPGWWRGEV